MLWEFSSTYTMHGVIEMLPLRELCLPFFTMALSSPRSSGVSDSRYLIFGIMNLLELEVHYNLFNHHIMRDMTLESFA